MVAGIERAASLGPGVINLSLGGSRSRLESDAIADAFRRGSLIVAAAGNGRAQGAEPAFPANLPHVLTVAATDHSNRVAVFSRQAPGMDVAAPGEAIPVALYGSSTGFSALSGTSLSTPIVAGAAAWIWTRRPELDRTQVFELVRRSARDLPPRGRDADTSFGLLDIPAALAAPAVVADPLEPSESVEQVGPGGVFPEASPALTSPGHARADLTARLDPTDDPRDVYRLWVAPRRRTVATLEAAREIRMRLLEAAFVPTSVRSGKRLTLTVSNRGSQGRYVYLNIFLPLDGTLRTAAYKLTLRTRPA